MFCQLSQKKETAEEAVSFFKIHCFLKGNKEGAFNKAYTKAC